MAILNRRFLCYNFFINLKKLSYNEKGFIDHADGRHFDDGKCRRGRVVPGRAWRSAVSGNYYFKKNGVSCFDLNAEQHYLFELGDKIRLYPLAGIRAAFWKVDDINANVGDVHIKVDGDSEMKIGFNVGGGIDYLIGDHLMLNGEIKYEYLKNADWVLFCVGVGYRF